MCETEQFRSVLTTCTHRFPSGYKLSSVLVLGTSEVKWFGKLSHWPQPRVGKRVHGAVLDGTTRVQMKKHIIISSRKTGNMLIGTICILILSTLNETLLAYYHGLKIVAVKFGVYHKVFTPMWLLGRHIKREVQQKWTCKKGTVAHLCTRTTGLP